MNFYFSFILILLFTLLLSITSSSKIPTSEIEKIINKSTVSILIQDKSLDDTKEHLEQRKYIKNWGSGIIIKKIEEDLYYILTNTHLLVHTPLISFKPYFPFFAYKEMSSIKGKYDVYIQGSPDIENTAAYRFRVDEWQELPFLDLTILRLDMRKYAKITNLPKFDAIQIEDDKFTQKLDKVYGAGYPLMPGNKGLIRELFITSSEINSVLRSKDSTKDLGSYTLVYRLGVKGGMSGGPVVNERGKLIGVNGLSEKGLTTEQASITNLGWVVAWFGSIFVEENIENVLNLDPNPEGKYDYGINIHDFILYASFLKENKIFNKTIFKDSLPDIDPEFEYKIKEMWVNGEWFLPHLGNIKDLQKALQKKQDEIKTMSESELYQEYQR